MDGFPRQTQGSRGRRVSFTCIDCIGRLVGKWYDFRWLTWKQQEESKESLSFDQPNKSDSCLSCLWCFDIHLHSLSLYLYLFINIYIHTYIYIYIYLSLSLSLWCINICIFIDMFFPKKTPLAPKKRMANLKKNKGGAFPIHLLRGKQKSLPYHVWYILGPICTYIFWLVFSYGNKTGR